VSNRLACEAFVISKICYRYQPRLSDENASIADWLIRLTHNQRNWGFGLCYLEGLGIEVDFSLSAEWVIRALDQISEWRGQPRVIRCDHGPEYVSAALNAWAERRGIRLEYIQPGKPQQNAYVERYNRTVRYDWLGQYLLESIAEVQTFDTRWLWTYNHQRPKMALEASPLCRSWPWRPGLYFCRPVEMGGLPCTTILPTTDN
jgi:TPR repeat protein